MFSTSRIRDNFSRVAYSYEKYADIQSKLGEELLNGLPIDGYKYKNILDVGCGTGQMLRELKKHYPKSAFTGLDISMAMARVTSTKIKNIVVADAICLPFKNESFNLVLSNVAYQWVFDLERAFKECIRILNPDGEFVFTCFGFETLKELRACFKIDHSYLPREEKVKDSLIKAGFSCVDTKTTSRNKYFDSLVDILSWLKYLGANRMNKGSMFLTPGKLACADNFYRSNYRSNGQVYATFEVISVKAKKNV